VTAARAAVTAAEQARVAECEKRGPRRREREKEEEPCDPRPRREDRNQDFDAGLSRLVCQENLTPLDASAFLDELEKLCRKLGIETKVGDDQRVYCLNVKVATALAGNADPVPPRPAYHS